MSQRLILLLCALLLGATNPDQLAQVYATAYGQYGSLHGGMPLPQSPPVEILTQEALCAKFGLNAHCNYLGRYYKGQIQLSDQVDLSTNFGASILLHEYVHYLQEQRTGHGPDGCEEYVEREREAYFIQAEILRKVGDMSSVMIVRMTAKQLPHCV